MQDAEAETATTTGTAAGDAAAGFPHGGGRSFWDRMAAAADLAKQGLTEQALALYADLRLAGSESPAPWLKAASLLREHKRFDEAERLGEESRRRFPSNSGVWSEWAFTAYLRRDWSIAAERWHQVLARYPELATAYVFGGASYWQLGRLDAAETLLLEAQRRFPGNAAGFVIYAQVAQHRRDWTEALLRWEEIRSRFPQNEIGYTAAANALRELGRLDEADVLLSAAAARLPDSTPAVDRARVAEARGDWAAVARAWAELSASDPLSAVSPGREAEALRRLGRLDEAEQVIGAALLRLPDIPDLAEQHGLNAIAREDWPVAIARLEAAARRFPGEARLRHRLYEVQLRVTGAGVAPAPIVAGLADDADRAVAMAFESLGGTGHGCEFGIFQRAIGAEPLGLLRWAGLPYEALCTALETEFAGVGEPEFTRLFVPPKSRGEYWTTDHRYGMAMRTFVFEDQVPRDRMIRQVTQRMRFLRRKLIEDLQAGTKIFVYKNMLRNLTDDELSHLHAAVRRYGDATLFYIRYGSPEHPVGEIEIAGPGLILGNVERFSHHPETDAFLGHVHQELLALCRKALDAWQPAARAGDAA